jgi:hypothetical protein
VRVVVGTATGLHAARARRLLIGDLTEVQTFDSALTEPHTQGMGTISLAELVAALPGDWRRHLDGDRVNGYRGRIGELDPIVVFDTPDGMLLADGYHRVEALLLEGKTRVEVDLRRGSKHDALEFAAKHGADQRGMSTDETRSVILERYQATGEDGSDGGATPSHRPP